MKSILKHYIATTVVFVLACGLLTTVFPVAVCATRTTTIGMISDGNARLFNHFRTEIDKEINLLLGSNDTIKIPDHLVLNANWSLETARTHYQTLVTHPDVDIIVGLGFMTGSVIAESHPFPKPVISLGLVDPHLFGLPEPTNNQSHIENLTYVNFNQSAQRDLMSFYEVYPYEKLGIIFYAELLKLPSFNALASQLMEDIPATLVPLPLALSDDDMFAILDADIDAVYISHLGPLEDSHKEQLIEAINQRKIPSFTDQIIDVERGVLAGISPEEDLVKLIRRVALNIEAILAGVNPAKLPVNLSFQERMTLNMATARRIGFSPRFDIMGKSDLLNQYDLATHRHLNLVEVMKNVQDASLDLRLETKDLQAARQDINQAMTAYLPSITLNGSGLLVEKETAESSMGQQAERTISGAVSGSQVVFSEQILANISTQRHAFTSAEAHYQETRRAVILNAAEAYFQVLLAQTAQTISKDNLDLIRQNLEIAKTREATGLISKGDVYRWESELASAVTQLITSQNQVKMTKRNLNRLLDRPINEPFVVDDVSLGSSLYTIYVDKLLKNLIDDPVSLSALVDFFIADGIRQSPEIQQLDAAIASLERQRQSLRLKRFVPTLAAQGEYSQTLDRSGAGADLPGVVYDDETWNVALSASIPIFSGGETTVELNNNRLNLERMKIQRIQLIKSIEFRVRNAVDDVMVQGVNLEASKRSADFARRSLELTQANYENGTVSIVELISAQNSALTAQSAALNSEYEYVTSVLNVEAEVGDFLLLGTPSERQAYADRLREFTDARLSNRKENN